MSFNIRDFKINIKLSFLIITFIMIALNFSEQFFILIVCTTFHELCHILVARIFKLKCKSIIITPLGQMAEIYGLEAISVYKRLLIAVVGIVFNLIVALISENVLIKNINILLVLLNVLPVYPMDGGRIVHYILCCKTGVLNANKLMIRLGIMVACIIILLGFIQLLLYDYNISLFCIGIYLIRLNKKQYFNNSFYFYKLMLNKSENRIMKIKPLAVGMEVSVKQLIYRLSWDYYTLIYIDGYVINQTQFIDYIMKFGINGTMEDVLLAKRC